jgi:hypothetical protein
LPPTYRRVSATPKRLAQNTTCVVVVKTFFPLILRVLLVALCVRFLRSFASIFFPPVCIGAEYNEDVIKPTLPTVDEQDDDAAQELAADAKTVSKESRTMAKKDDISLVL